MSRDWALLRLGDFLSELPKSTLPASCSEANGAYAFYCSSSEPKAADTWLQEQPAILMGTGGVASVHLGKGKYAYSTDTWAIRIKESAKLTQPYAYRVLELSLPKIDYAGFEGSGLRHLRKSYIKDFRFLAPSDSAPQKRIVSILDGIDTAIEKTEALIAKYQQIKAGLMHDLFTRGVLPNGKLRPPREQAPELYQETAIGWIPREWGVKPCADLCSRICVGIVIQPTQYYVEDGVPAFRSANVREDGIDPNNFVYISAGANRLLAKSQVKTGDIVSVRTGYPGTSAVIPPEFQGANCIDILISTPNEKVTSEYLCDWINSSFGKGQVLRQQGGMAQQHFNVGEMRELLVALPDLNEQERIRGKIKSVSGKLAIEKALAEKLQAQKSGLMHDLLTGKVPVNIKKTTTTEVAA